MNKKNFIFVIILVVANIIIFTNNKTQSQTLDQKKLIKVGMELKYPPFETVDANGKPAGFSVEMAKYITSELNQDLEIVPLDYPSLIPAIESKQIDLIISSMTITKQRKEKIDFSNPYYISPLVYAYNENNKIETPSDLNGKKIGIKRGTVGKQWVDENLTNVKVVEYDDTALAILALNNQEIDAVIYDPITLIQQSKDLPKIKVNTEGLPNVSGWGIGLAKNNDKYLESLNKTLDKMKKEKVLEDFRDKYLTEEVEKYEKFGLKFGL